MGMSKDIKSRISKNINTTKDDEQGHKFGMTMHTKGE